MPGYTQGHLMAHHVGWKIVTIKDGLKSQGIPRGLRVDGGGTTLSLSPYVMSVGQSRSLETHIPMLWLMRGESFEI